MQVSGLPGDYPFGVKQLENGNGGSELDSQSSSANFVANAPGGMVSAMDENIVVPGNGKDTVAYDLNLMTEPYGVPCMVEIFHFLCSLLNVVEHMAIGPKANTIAFDEDVPLFALGLINSAIELGGTDTRDY